MSLFLVLRSVSMCILSLLDHLFCIPSKSHSTTITTSSLYVRTIKACNLSKMKVSMKESLSYKNTYRVYIAVMGRNELSNWAMRINASRARSPVDIKRGFLSRDKYSTLSALWSAPSGYWGGRCVESRLMVESAHRSTIIPKMMRFIS